MHQAFGLVWLLSLLFLFSLSFFFSRALVRFILRATKKLEELLSLKKGKKKNVKDATYFDYTASGREGAGRGCRCFCKLNKVEQPTGSVNKIINSFGSRIRVQRCFRETFLFYPTPIKLFPRQKVVPISRTKTEQKSTSVRLIATSNSPISPNSIFSNSNQTVYTVQSSFERCFKVRSQRDTKRVVLRSTWRAWGLQPRSSLEESYTNR